MIALFGIPVTAYVARVRVPDGWLGMAIGFLMGFTRHPLSGICGSNGGVAAMVRESRAAEGSGCRSLNRIERSAADEIGFLPPPPASVQRESRRLGYS